MYFTCESAVWGEVENGGGFKPAGFGVGKHKQNIGLADWIREANGLQQLLNTLDKGTFWGVLFDVYVLVEVLNTAILSHDLWFLTSKPREQSPYLKRKTRRVGRRLLVELHKDGVLREEDGKEILPKTRLRSVDRGVVWPKADFRGGKRSKRGKNVIASKKSFIWNGLQKQIDLLYSF